MFDFTRGDFYTVDGRHVVDVVNAVVDAKYPIRGRVVNGGGNISYHAWTLDGVGLHGQSSSLDLTQRQPEQQEPTKPECQSFMQGEWQTRDGQPVRILCDDAPLPTYPVVGLVGADVRVWTVAGKYDKFTPESHLDLVPVPKTPKPRAHADLIKRWADDQDMRLKWRENASSEWCPVVIPTFYPGYEYAEILPGDPLW